MPLSVGICDRSETGDNNHVDRRARGNIETAYAAVVELVDYLRDNGLLISGQTVHASKYHGDTAIISRETTGELT